MIDAYLVLGGVFLALGPALGSQRKAGRRRLATWVSIAHPAVAIVLVASLALHMHQSLGGWPEFIGTPDGEFSTALAVHAHVAYGVFGSMMVASVIVLPIFAVVLAAVPQYRSSLRYLCAYGSTSLAAFGTLYILPQGFQYWWWD
jgi:Na+/phosphate symporter